MIGGQERDHTARHNPTTAAIPRPVAALRAALPPLLRALIGVLITYPLALVASVYLSGSIYAFLSAIAVGALLAALKGRLRLLLALGLGVAAAVIGAAVCSGPIWLRIPAALVCGGSLIASTFLNMPARGAIQPARLILWGIGVHVAGYVFGYFSGDTVLTSRIMLATPGMLVILMMMMNEDALRTGMAAQGGARVPGRLMSGNRALMLVFALAALIVYHIDTVRRFLGDVAKMGALLIARALLFLSSLFPTSSAPGGGSGEMGMMDMGVASEQGLFATILEYIAYALGALITLALLGLLLFLIGRGLKRLYRRLSAALQNLTQALGEDYQEQRERLAAPGDLLSNLGESLLKRARALTAREKRWAHMDNRERARYLVRRMYRRALPGDPQLAFRSVREGAGALTGKRGGLGGNAPGTDASGDGNTSGNGNAPAPGNPPTNESPDAWVAAYESARYSNQEITDAMVEAIRAAESAKGAAT